MEENQNVPHPIDLSGQTPTPPIGVPGIEPAISPATPPPIGAVTTPAATNLKKYIIIGVAVLLLAAGGFAAYSYFFSSDSASESDVEVDLSNSLSSDAPAVEAEEMEEIVDELKDMYPNDSPPSLSLDMSEVEVVENTESESADTEVDPEVEDESSGTDSVDDASSVIEEEAPPKKIAR